RDRRLVAARGLVVSPEALENLPEIAAADGRIGPQRDGALNERQSGLEIPGLQRYDAEQVPRIRGLGGARENTPIAVLGVREPAGAMALERAREGSIRVDLRHRSCPIPAPSTGRHRSVWKATGPMQAVALEGVPVRTARGLSGGGG